jgi:hypothetical protein
MSGENLPHVQSHTFHSLPLDLAVADDQMEVSQTLYDLVPNGFRSGEITDRRPSRQVQERMLDLGID